MSAHHWLPLIIFGGTVGVFVLLGLVLGCILGLLTKVRPQATESRTSSEGELRQSAPEEFREPPDAVRRTRLFGWVFVVFGTLFALFFGVNEIVPPVTASSAIAEGTVVKEVYNEGPVAVFQYQVNGKTYTCEQHHAVSRHRVGETVSVVYKADDPAVASIDSFYDRWFIPALLSGGGVLFAGFGALLVWTARWARVQ